MDMGANVKLYLAKDRVPDRWNELPGGAYLRSMLVNSPRFYVKNVDCEFAVLEFGNKLIPITFGVREKRNTCRLSSLNAHFLDAASELLEGSEVGRLLQFGLRSIIRCIRCVSQLDRSVLVNNWLLSTNLWQSLDEQEVLDISEFLKNVFPGCAVVFCSINKKQHEHLLNSKRLSAFHAVISRQIVFLNKAIFASKRQYKRDRKWWSRQTKYRWSLVERSLSFDEVQRVHGLFQGLYMHRHSVHNPDYTPGFVEMTISTQFWDMWRLLDSVDNCCAVTCLVKAGGTMTNPFNGYDLSLPKSEGLYAAMRLHTISRADSESYELNMSSASVEHKVLRGGEPTLEYFFCYYEHLSFLSRIFWKAFIAIGKQVLEPMVVRFNV